ncbi:MAG: ATP-binding protein [Actinomycetota bacterium]
MTAQRALEGARDRAAQELRESEARSWRLLSKTLELLFVIDQDGRFAWVNPATEAQLGYEAGELLGGSRLDLIHPDDVEMVEEAIEDKLAGGRIDVQPIVSRIRHKDGSWRTIETRGINLLDDPVVHGILVSARDITDRVEMERERERLELERRVAQRLEAVGQLAAGIAHEINTPIQFVGDSVRFLEESYADLDVLRARHRDLLLEHGLAEQVLEAEEEADLAYLCERVPSAFHRITDGVERVTTIVRAMQRFAHAPRAERAPANLDEALGATATVSRSEYKYVADLELDLGELPPVLCNVGDLNQVFLNLIVNAAHAIADRVGDSGERGTIVVRSRVEPDMGNVLVEVVDDGCGIDPDARERIFEPFFTTKDVGRGTGQGLAISRSIVEQHGGSITFSSELGKGTTFSVRIPLQCGDVEAEAA